MNIRRTLAKRVEEVGVNEGVPSQGGQVHQDEQVHLVDQENEVPVDPPDMTNEEVRRSLVALARPITA